MEYTLGGHGERSREVQSRCVLILVVMEYTLGGNVQWQYQNTIESS